MNFDIFAHRATHCCQLEYNDDYICVLQTENREVGVADDVKASALHVDIAVVGERVPTVPAAQRINVPQ